MVKAQTGHLSPRGAVNRYQFVEILVLTLLVFNILGCSWFDSNNRTELPEAEEVVQTEPPQAAFTVSSQSGKAPLVVTFNDNSQQGSASINSWQWDFGDGNNSNEQNHTT